MISFAPEEFVWGKQIGIPRYLDTYADLEFLRITVFCRTQLAKLKTVISSTNDANCP